MKQSLNDRRPQKAVWEDNRHGYENKMADEDWNTTNNSANQQNTWGTYDYNAAWNDDSSTINNPNNQTSSYTQSQTSQHQPQSNSGKKDGFSLFLAESSAFPTWDD